MLYLDIFSLEFEKNTDIFEASVVKIAFLQSLVQRQKSLNLRPKVPDLVTFGLQFENNIVIFEISTLEFV